MDRRQQQPRGLPLPLLLDRNRQRTVAIRQRTRNQRSGQQRRNLADAPRAPQHIAGRNPAQIASHLDSECEWLLANSVLPADLVTQAARWLHKPDGCVLVPRLHADVRTPDQLLEVLTAVRWRVLVVRDDMLEVVTCRLHGIDLRGDRLDALADDVLPGRGGIRPAEDLADLVQAHLPGLLPEPDDRQLADLVLPVPAAARPPGDRLH